MQARRDVFSKQARLFATPFRKPCEKVPGTFRKRSYRRACEKSLVTPYRNTYRKPDPTRWGPPVVTIEYGASQGCGTEEKGRPPEVLGLVEDAKALRPNDINDKSPLQLARLLVG